MRFLVFNAVVIGALVVLFTADGDRLQGITNAIGSWGSEETQTASTDAPKPVQGEVNTQALFNERAIAEPTQDAVSDTSNLIETVLDTVRQSEQATTTAANRSEQAAVKTEALLAKLETLVEKAEVSAKAAVTAAKEAASQKSTPTPVASVAAPTDVVAEAQKPSVPVKPVTTQQQQSTPTQPVVVASNDLPVQEVAKLPTHVVDYSQTVNPGQTTTQVAAAPTTGVAIAEGEKLMTPRERRRELNALARDMENVFLRHAMD